MRAQARALFTKLLKAGVRVLPAARRAEVVRLTYQTVEQTLDEGERVRLRQRCLSDVFQGVQGGADPVETWQTRKYAFDRYLGRFSLLNSSDTARIYGLITLLASLDDVPGAIVECGVGLGKSLAVLVYGASLLEQDRAVFGFDSFQGFPPATAHDLGPRVTAMGIPDGWTKTSPAFIETIFEADRARKDSMLRRHPVPVKMTPGFFAETLPAHAPTSIALLHVDCDLYESTRDVLTHCLPRMTPGGVVVFDEYQDVQWPGATKAVDELCAAYGLEVIFLPHAQRFGLRIPRTAPGT